MPFRQTTVSGIPAVALRSAELEVVVAPSLGAKLTNLRRLRGREWLWRNPRIPLARPAEPTSYVEAADSGGWDECFPTVGPSPVPGAPPGAPELPDHGELWSTPWRASAYDHAAGTTFAGTVAGRRLPYEFSREVTLSNEAPAVRLRYRLRHTGGDPFPWIWSSHPLLNVQPGSVLELPGVRQVRVYTVHGRHDLRPGDDVTWPDALGGEGGAFRFPERGGWALKLFADLGPEGRMALTDPRQGERLELVVDPREVPQVGVWVNVNGWAPAGLDPYYNLGLEPCIGAPDRLDQAVLEWRMARTLAPGEERSWSVEVRLP
ncbi:MAG TPA: hypothetical protein VFK09_07190 [Gemmatimonadales bacterium]|nr:hypothetical protein [Gemmatimonadales bacterium]